MGRGDYLGELEHLVLLALTRHGTGPAGYTGAAVHAELEAVGRATSLPVIYVTLARLERKGLIRGRAAPPTGQGGRRARLFSLTGAGARALLDARRVLERMWSTPAHGTPAPRRG